MLASNLMAGPTAEGIKGIRGGFRTRAASKKKGAPPRGATEQIANTGQSQIPEQKTKIPRGGAFEPFINENIIIMSNGT